MGEAIGGMMGSSKAILLGRRTYQEFATSWSTRTAEEDPGAPFMNEVPNENGAARRLQRTPHAGRVPQAVTYR
jgi:hypothetical protein